jgi:hypothetical protein
MLKEIHDLKGIWGNTQEMIIRKKKKVAKKEEEFKWSLHRLRKKEHFPGLQPQLSALLMLKSCGQRSTSL